MSKLKVTTIANVADSESTDVTNVINGSAKAWVNFDGTFGTSPFTVANGGIRAAFNVSSVTDNGTGDYTVNFTTAMPDANYASISRGSITSAAGSGNLDDDHVISRSLTTLNVRLECSNSAAVKVNFAEVYVAIFR